MPSAKECKEFVESVLNGYYKDRTGVMLNGFVKRYRDWFPPDPPDGPNKERYVEVLLFTWDVPQLRWCKDSIKQDNPKTFFELHVAVLRDRLRSVWIADPNSARGRLRKLTAETMEGWEHLDRTGRWRERQLVVCDWLEKWLSGRKGSRLLVCQNPECDETKYFVREAKEPNKKYCSSLCAISADELRRLERRKQGQRRQLSPTGLAAIREGQRKRRRRERMKAAGSGRQRDR